MDMKRDEVEFEKKKESVKEQIIIDLSKSNEHLELENRQLKLASIGLLQKLKRWTGEDAQDLRKEFNLTVISGSSSADNDTKNKKGGKKDKSNRPESVLELPGRSLDDEEESKSNSDGDGSSSSRNSIGSGGRSSRGGGRGESVAPRRALDSP